MNSLYLYSFYVFYCGVWTRCLGFPLLSYYDHQIPAVLIHGDPEFLDKIQGVPDQGDTFILFLVLHKCCQILYGKLG